MQWRLTIYLGVYGPMKRRTRMFALQAESFPARQSGSRCSFAVIVTSASLSENAVRIQLVDQARKTYPPSPKAGSTPTSRTPKNVDAN